VRNQRAEVKTDCNAGCTQCATSLANVSSVSTCVASTDGKANFAFDGFYPCLSVQAQEFSDAQCGQLVRTMHRVQSQCYGRMITACTASAAADEDATKTNTAAVAIGVVCGLLALALVGFAASRACGGGSRGGKGSRGGMLDAEEAMVDTSSAADSVQYQQFQPRAGELAA
jgi:hypothetical protein